MPDLSARNLARCANCGKLIPLDPERQVCVTCAEDQGIPVAPPAPFADLTTELACKRCRMRNRLEDSEFCLNCQVDIVADLGEKARELSVHMETLEEAHEPTSGAYESLQAKRRSTPTSHINVVGGQPLRGRMLR
jgi:hypothetical protein